jgi:hypothetical protein
MIALLKRQARARQPGAKPEPAKRWTSVAIMAVAGNEGMLSVAKSRRVCGYRWTSQSRYVP